MTFTLIFFLMKKDTLHYFENTHDQNLNYDNENWTNILYLKQVLIFRGLLQFSFVCTESDCRQGYGCGNCTKK